MTGTLPGIPLHRWHLEQVDHMTDLRRADLRRLGNDELLSRLDTLAYDLAEVDEVFADDPESLAVACELRERDLAETETELRRRTHLFAAGARVPDPHGPDYAGWAILAGQVRACADIVHLFERLGIELVQAGHNSRRDSAEYGSACPFCGGVDRFRVWDGPPGGYWCRQCHAAGDVISAFQMLYGAGFRETLRRAAGELRLALPTPAMRVTIDDVPGGPVIHFDRHPPHA